VLRARGAPGDGWFAPPNGKLGIWETPDGIAMITAEWLESFFSDTAQAIADEVLDSIVVGG